MRVLLAVVILFLLISETHAQCTLFVCRSPDQLDELNILSDGNMWDNFNASKARLQDNGSCRTFCLSELKDTGRILGRYWIFRDTDGIEWYWQ